MGALQNRVSSRNNPAVKEIRKLRTRKARDETRLYFVEGVRIVSEALRVCAPVRQIVYARDLLPASAQKLIRRVRDAGIPCLEVPGEVYESLSLRDDCQGIGAVIQQRWDRLHHATAGAGLCWVALWGVQFPGNLGTILRTSDAVGGAGIVLLGTTTDPYHPDAIQASRGAVFSQRLVRTDPARFGAWVREQNAFVVGTSPAAEVDYRSSAFRSPTVLLMGSERWGLPEEALDICSSVVRIPMVGFNDSLNLAVATGVLLYDLFSKAGRG